MSFAALYLVSGLVILSLMTILWLVSLFLKNSSIVDIFWGTGFVITYWLAAWINPSALSARVVLLGMIVTIWGLRLTIHIFLRNHGKPEDFRYAAWRREASSAWWWQSFFKVFLLQGVILWIVATPLIAAQTSASDSALNWLDFAGTFVWLTGFIFEAGGDWQLARFKSDPSNRGKLLTTGLWSLTRHPNYFGDAAQWWGFYFIACASGAWWTAFSPLVMTFLLMKVSGVVMLEKTLKQSKPGYEEYIARTNAFFPWLPKSRRPN